MSGPILCPACGKPLDGEAPHAILTHLALSPAERRLVEAFVRAYPRTLQTEFLVEALYGHRPDGGPETAVNNIAVNIHRLNPRLRALGWEIAGLVGRGKRGRNLRRVSNS